MPLQKTPGRFHVRLRPEHQGSFTHWSISGSTPTSLPPWLLRRLMRAMAFWSGWPVELVLPVALETAPWWQWWADALAEAPDEDLHIRFEHSSEAGE